MDLTRKAPEHRLLRRREAALYIRETWGLPCAEKTISKLAVVGGGPAFFRAGRVPLYDIADLDAWARSKLTGPHRSTSET